MATRFGLIGVGGIGYLQATTYVDIAGVSLVAAADVSPAARQLFEEEFGAPAYEGYEELLGEHADELDAVTIATPHTLHYEQTKACLEHDLHVLVEKPMVTDVTHAVDLVATAADRDRVLQVGYQRHFHPGFEEIRRILRDGRIGEVHAVNCYLGQDWINMHRDTWRTDPDLSGGGQLYDTGSHLLDALLWTTESTPATVTAQVEYVVPGIDVNSALAVRLERGDEELLASVGVSGNGLGATPAEGYFYWGTGGRLSFTNGQIVVAEKAAMTYSTDITSGTDFQTLNRRKLENFIASIEGSAEPAVPGEVGIQITALTESVYEAADSGRRVAVQPVIEAATAARD